VRLICENLPVTKPPLKRIYFDTNPLYRWPHIPSDIPSMLGVANWVGAELYMPKIVEDELEGQYVRSIEASYDKLNADVKELNKLCRNVMTPDISGSEPMHDQVREAFRVRSEQLKAHFKISTIPIHEMTLATLIQMAINRDEPFEQIEISKTKHVVVGLQDTAILFAIAKHMQTAAEGDRCAFLSNDDVFHRAGTKNILKSAGVKLEMFKKTSDLFNDLFEHVMDAIRTEWNAEMNQIEASLNEEKEQLTSEILGLITTADIGRGIWKRTLEIKSFRITEFTQVKTELPESEHRPPHAEKYKRPEGGEVLISARVSTESDVLAESLNFVGLFTGDYTKEEPSNTVENLKVKDTLAVSLKGIVMGDKIGNFKVVNAEPAR
jgi:PIN domain